jgi:hypothetical protein
MKKIYLLVLLLCYCFTVFSQARFAGDPKISGKILESDWKELSKTIGKVKGDWNAPPQSVVTRNMTAGAILGNGDLGVVMGGSVDTVAFYISKSDFWNTNSMTCSLGRVSVKCPDTGNGNIGYHLEQNILNAELNSQLRFNGNPIHIRSFVGSDENTFINFISGDDKTSEIRLEIDLSTKTIPFLPLSKADESVLDPSKDINTWLIWVNKKNFTSTAGYDGNLAWVTRTTGDGPKYPPVGWHCYGAISAKVIGGENCKAVDRGNGTSSIFVTIPKGKSVILIICVEGGKDEKDCLSKATMRTTRISAAETEKLDSARAAWWKDYWLKQYVIINDEFMEKCYYSSLYQIGTSYRRGKIPPGLYGVWVTTDDPYWMGGYTMDYNFYKNFIGMASSNRLEQFNMCDVIMNYIPAGRIRAQNFRWYNAFEPLTPNAGIEIPTQIGPFGQAVQFYDYDCGMKSNAAFAACYFNDFYLYSRDTLFLKNYVYPYLREVVDFADWNLKKNSSGRYMVYESQVMESSFGYTDFNPVLDLVFLRLCYKKILEYSRQLNLDFSMRDRWSDILENLSDMPVDVNNGKLCYRFTESSSDRFDAGFFPFPLWGVYPAMNVNLGSNETDLTIYRNTMEQFYPWYQANVHGLITSWAAKLGWDAEDLYQKTKTRYQNIIRKNLTFQSDGHGIEGSSVIQGINDMLVQGYDGDMIRFFPVWPGNQDAKFKRIRGHNGFLMDGEIKGNVVCRALIHSSLGGQCKVLNPWKGRKLIVTSGGKVIPSVNSGDTYSFNTISGEAYELSPEGGLPKQFVIPKPVNLAIGKPARQSSDGQAKNRLLAIAEVEIFGPDLKTDLALGSRATQSSNGRRESTADKAVDGNTDGTLYNRSVAYTKIESNPWWETDLGKTEKLNLLKVYFRTDAELYRKNSFNNFIISVLDSARKEVWKKFVEDYPDQRVSILTGGIEGRYVRISKQAMPGENGASKAVDGITEGYYSDSYTMTQDRPDQWWKVDLLKTYKIGNISVYNNATTRYTGDANIDYISCLKDFKISILDEGGKEVWSDFQQYYPTDRYVTDADGVEGRYVMIKKESASGPLSLAEVVVNPYVPKAKEKHSLQNLVIGKKAYQSSTYSGADATRSADGNIDGEFSKGSVSMTEVQSNPWWEVDLGKESVVRNVEIYNRTDSCKTELCNFYLQLFDSNHKKIWEKHVKTYPDDYMSYGTEGTKGRYLRITLAYPGYLSLAEVKVFGDSQQDKQIKLK